MIGGIIGSSEVADAVLVTAIIGSIR